MKAIAYVANVPIPDTQEVISIAEQKQRIKDFAARFNIELIDIIEESSPMDMDIMDREGIKTLIHRLDDVDIVLFERIWSITRKTAKLNPFLKILDEKQVPVYSVTVLWDCLSQVIRRKYKGVSKQFQQSPAPKAYNQEPTTSKEHWNEEISRTPKLSLKPF